MLNSPAMTNMESVLTEALKLNESERTHVAQQLLRSVPDMDDAERAELEKALDEGEANVAAGRVHSLSDVISELRATL